MRKNDKKLFVSKEIQFAKMTEKERQQLVTEVNILRELRHPNIVKYYDRVIDKQNQKIYIIMEYCEGGDLAHFLKKMKKDKEEFPEEAIWKILSQIILALFEIHKRKEGKIFHRDIKPANIFLDAQNNVKLGDFGLAKMLGEEGYLPIDRDTGFKAFENLLYYFRIDSIFVDLQNSNMEIDTSA